MKQLGLRSLTAFFLVKKLKMNSYTTPYLLYAAVSLLSAMGAYIIKGLLLKLDEIEKKMDDMLTENEIRQLIHDKSDPIISDIKDIKEKVTKLFDLYLQSLQSLKSKTK